MNDNIRTITGVPPLTVENADGLPLVDYKIYGNSEQRNLPSEYEEVEYLESTGTQYIDTGYSPNNNSKMLVDYQPTVAQTKSYIGARNKAGTAGAISFSVTSGNNSTQMFASWGDIRNFDIGNMTTERVTAQIGQDGIYFNGEKKTTPTAQTWSLTQRVLLFAMMQRSTSTDFAVVLQSEAKIYKCKIWESDVLVRDFIPCYRKSDNVAGMYDAVTGTFFTNSGTGEFTVGADAPTPQTPIEIQSVGDLVTDQSDVNYGKYKIPVKVNTILPVAYQEVEYLESTGTQYIDTLMSVSMSTNMEIKLMPTISTSSNVFPFSARPVANTPNINSYYANETINFEVGNTIQKIGSASMPINTENIIKFDNHKIYNNDVYVGDYSDRTITNTTSLLLFAARSNNVVDNRMFVGRLYYCKIYDSNTLARDFIPCYRKSDNKPGLYDTVTNTFFTNSGSGEFTVGPEADVTNIYLDEPLRKIGDYADYIDFANQKAVRNVEVIDDTGTLPIEQSLRGLATPTEETIDLPEISLEDGTNTIAVPTEVTPSNMELQYYLFVNKLYSENAVANIAKAIREKNGTANTYTIKEMAAAIRALNVTPAGEGVGD